MLRRSAQQNLVSRDAEVRRIGRRSDSACGHPLLRFGPGLLAFAVYCLTLAPTVTGEDSGEFITAAYFFGVPHPPGYPLWTVLSGVWAHLLPLGSVAWRCNLFSAAGMAAAIHCLAATLRIMGFRPLVAAVAAAACAFGDAVWSQSVITEVYALNLLLTALLMLSFARWRATASPRPLIWASLVLGLGMSNHHTIGFVALALGVWAVTREPGILRNRSLLLGSALAFCLGLLPYAYPLWAARRDVPVKWGETTTLAALWEHVSRGQYKSEHPIEAPQTMTVGLLAGRLYYGFRWVSAEVTPLLLPLVVAGFVRLFQRLPDRCWFWFTALFCICCGPLFLYAGGPQLDRQDEFVQKVFLTPLTLALAIPLAAGLQWTRTALRRFHGNASVRARRSAFALICLGVVAIPLAAHWRSNNMRHYWWAHDNGRNILACMLPGGIIFPSGDHNTFPLIYLIHVEGVRPDVTIADKYGYIDLDLYADMPDSPGKPRSPEEREAIEEWIIRHAHRPVYYTIKKTAKIEKAGVVQAGLLYHLLPEDQSFDGAACWKDLHYRNLEGLEAPEDLAAMNILADYYYALGMRELVAGRRETAQEQFKTCLAHAWGMKEIHNNVASAMAEYDLLDEAIGIYEAAAKMDWRYAAARWNLARIFKQIGKFEWSAKVFEDLTQAMPGDFRPFGESGFLWRDHLGDRRRAQECWYESLRINPRQDQIIAALAELRDLPPPSDPPLTTQAATSAPTSGRQLAGLRPGTPSTSPSTAAGDPDGEDDSP